MDDIAPLIRIISDTIEPVDTIWTEFSLVIGLNEKGVPVQNFGYAYQPDLLPVAIVADDFAFEDALKSFVASRFPDGTIPARILIQFNINSKRYNVVFEENDKARWQVTPLNLDEIQKTLKPGLG